MSVRWRTLADVVAHDKRRPDWVAPTWWQVGDLSCLAMHAVVEQQRPDCAGMVAAVGWVRGAVAGPITGRDGHPITRQLAVAEMWAAAAAQPDQPAPPLAELAVMLRVEHREPLPVEPLYARGVWLALRWLTGTGDQATPLELPVRNSAGGLASADEVYAALAAERGFVPAEEIGALRVCADRTAARSRQLAALIADTAHRIRS